MPVSRRLHQPCTIRYWSQGPPDARNDPSDDWTEVETRCQMQQRGRQELGAVGQLSDTTWLVTFAPDEQPPRSVDQLIVSGTTYEFRGDSWPAHSLAGGLDHIEATVARAA